MEPLIQRIISLTDKYEAHTLELRRAIHCHPELAFHETETSALVCRELNSIGISYQLNPVKPGVVAELDSGKPGKLLLLRADMDALPIQEDTGLPFSSQIPGVMHACGHDVHTANLLAAARILYDTKDAWSGRVRLVFQPGEESGRGGCQMIEQGLMDDMPDACFALHVLPGKPGTIIVGSGPLTSYTDGFYITVHGKAAHSSTPEKGVDAINIAASIVTSLNTIIARNVDPLEFSTLNIGVIKGGTASNIIPEQAELIGIMRNATSRTRQILMKRIQEISQGIATAMGGRAEVEYRPGCASVYNEEALADFASNVFREEKEALFLGITPTGQPPQEWLLTGDRFLMAAEDFGFYSQKAPSCFIWVGTGDRDSNHSPHFEVEEPYIKLCTRVMSLFAVKYLTPCSPA